MTLLVEAGASGLQWARLEGSTPGAVGGVVHRGVEPEEWQAPLATLSPAPRRVVVANTAGAAFGARFGDWSRRQWQVAAEFPVAAREVAEIGVRNGYARPETLPIDRWLALLAAWWRTRAALVVVGAAGAVSVDLVDDTGRHRGGCVLPGERLMREALYAQTSGIAAAALPDAAAVEGVFGINTAGGVQQGARLALAAVVDRAAQALGVASSAAPRIYMTGAASQELAPLLTRPVERVPHLVLQGLALLVAGVLR